MFKELTLFLIFVLCSSCSSGDGRAADLVVSVDSLPANVVVGRPESSFFQCHFSFSKRVVYVLFVLPVGKLSEEDLDKGFLSEPFGYRVHETILPADVVLTLLGFLFSVHTKTVVVEECDGFASSPWQGERLNEALTLRKMGIPVIPILPKRSRAVSTQPVYDVLLSTLRYDEKENRVYVRIQTNRLEVYDEFLLVFEGERSIKLRPEDVSLIKIKSNVDSGLIRDRDESNNRR